MSGKFLHHTSCDNCGSRDNRALYSDGSSWCFGCHHYIPGKVSPYIIENDSTTSFDKSSKEALNSYFKVLTRGFPSWIGSSYLNQYGITISDLLYRDVWWSSSKQQLAFCHRDGNGEIIFAAARNFHPMAKSKWQNYGSAEEILPIYKVVGGGSASGTVESTRQQLLVLVEDSISAIKIARISDSMPCLTSTLSLTKINRLARLLGPSVGIVVWLDGNMYHKAQQIARRFELLGLSAKAVYTADDPKCYDMKQIETMLDS